MVIDVEPAAMGRLVLKSWPVNVTFTLLEAVIPILFKTGKVLIALAMPVAIKVKVSLAYTVYETLAEPPDKYASVTLMVIMSPEVALPPTVNCILPKLL